MSDITMTFAADGYSQSLDVEHCSYVAAMVTPDDSGTWKMQGSLKDVPTSVFDWHDIPDDDSNYSKTINDAPAKFDVDKYCRIRIWVSDPAKGTTLHLKRMAGI